MASLYIFVLLLVWASNVAMRKEVLCVWNSKDFKAVNESVSCYNDNDSLQNSNISIEGELPKTLIPGVEIALDISIKYNDETVNPLIFYVEVTGNNITIDPAYSTISDNKIKVCGCVGCKGEIRLSLRDQPQLGLGFSITLNCQPGYVVGKDI